ncbi:putative NAD(P)H nitroreductase YdgI [Brevibacillus agri]|uniref:NAD(P)H nitroreductase YdgI n=1 Tax=Brevibacillus agri TaxID=51101 RepID=A0A3M8A235_9BACL|nr:MULTISPECIES: nitroreductase family protein [Brevibacillus]MBG9565854.1 NAD(P)H nitroreductase [Brevibacillus agri]MCG5253175.1 nitroreductase family protein [Brevibacillus agri]MDN4092261.1 nitroreductase family protein [Brevibacillus agri]MDR9505557.1 nitroreductase family protein [Brevibacillus agri]MED1645039.1 nitroreductase family protein [Brevibacillus agri]
MEQVMNKKAFFDVISERRSVRHYDPTVKISRDELKEMLAEATLAPSSSNLQPWRFLIIDEQELKEKLLPIAFNQKQVVEAAAIVAVLGDYEGYKQAEQIYQKAIDAGYMTEEAKATMIANINRRYENRERSLIKEIALVDGGLVSMQFMLVAKARGYDTVPMGGYNAELFKEAFNISDRYETVMLIAVGKAAQPGHPTTRLDVDDITFWNEMPSK